MNKKRLFSCDKGMRKQPKNRYSIITPAMCECSEHLVTTVNNRWCRDII